MIRKDTLRKFKSYYKDALELDFSTEPSTGLGLGGSTFRSFTGFCEPSKTYKNWYYKELSKFDDKILNCRSRRGFVEIHKKLRRSLDSHWRKEQRSPLSFFQRNKIIDLCLKYQCCTYDIKSILKYGNIPIDKFSLIFIRELFYGIVLSKNPSMGDIDCEETYEFLQETIYELTSKAKVPNLYFDLIAWNLTH